MLRDGVQGAVSITEPRLKKCLVHIDKVFSDPKVSARDLASLVGKIISMSAVLGNLSRTGILLHHSGLLIFRAVAEPRISSKSAKSREIHKNTRNPAKFAKNLTKYMSPQHI